MMHGAVRVYTDSMNAAMEKQSTHFICIIYPEKYNSTILLMYCKSSYQAVSLTNIQFWTKQQQATQKLMNSSHIKLKAKAFYATFNGTTDHNMCI